jgi:hypothetical protein
MIPEESARADRQVEHATAGAILHAMVIDDQSETRIVIGRLCDPSDPARSWWWQSSMKVGGNEVTVAGFATTENDAILEAAASSLQFRSATTPEPPAVRKTGADWE